ncbi:sigma-70 family RNA polymerase sigma factor [Clostridium subterminale]|uniref:Sigma-70 family RNA polymerase sigma factor n=1 Tax=Clostridium subterminale TaxID=1550 RepID=A0ABN1KLN5_CLOSU
MRVNKDNFIAELKRKNPKALDYIIDIYGPLIKGIISKTLYSIEDKGLVEECISDVFMAIWVNGYKFTGDSSKFKSWIGAITKFKAIDYFRKYCKKENNELVDESITDGKSAEDRYLDDMYNSRLVSIIENMDEPDKTIFIMKFLLGEKSNSISEALKLSVSNINTRISRGKEKIRREYYTEAREGV